MLLFKYQAYLGLRVGEISKLHMNNINFDKRELTIKSKKSHKLNSLLIPLDLFKETMEYIVKNKASIKASSGYVFFKENDNNSNNLLHVEQNYVRKVFRETIVSANLDYNYGYSDENYGEPQCTLHRLTTHSLRHYAITRFSKANNGNIVLTCRYARHASPTTTIRYIAKDNEQLYKEIDNIFSDHVIQNVRTLSKIINKE